MYWYRRFFLPFSPLDVPYISRGRGRNSYLGLGRSRKFKILSYFFPFRCSFNKYRGPTEPESMRHSQDDRLAYISPQFCNPIESEWRRREDRAKVRAACQQPNHARYLHPSQLASKEAGTNESSPNDLAGAESNCRGGRREVIYLIVPFCSHAGDPNFPQVLEKKWRGRRDSNSRPLP